MRNFIVAICFLTSLFSCRNLDESSEDLNSNPENNTVGVEMIQKVGDSTSSNINNLDPSFSLDEDPKSPPRK